eukprot:TRINITY_DN37867_c0_g1_i1.p1 TRINITY_DN37867_c0_g1~~TRINITY_DN37867_c0_g1_i1.p1  ORF type:complete len:307 (-),score=67.46 TRINITY_DN37867_c0_g1_i1:10-930(-)
MAAATTSMPSPSPATSAAGGTAGAEARQSPASAASVCRLCRASGFGSTGCEGLLERPCGCYAPPDGVHLPCLLSALRKRPRWWADMTCQECRWWYVGALAVPLAEAGLEAAETAHGGESLDVALALACLSRALRGAAASAEAASRDAQMLWLERRRLTLQRALSIREGLDGQSAEELWPLLEELADVCGQMGQEEAKQSLLEKAFRLQGGARRGDEASERRARVLGKLSQSLQRHSGDGYGVSAASLSAAEREAYRRLEERFPLKASTEVQPVKELKTPHISEVLAEAEDEGLGFCEDTAPMVIDS